MQSHRLIIALTLLLAFMPAQAETTPEQASKTIEKLRQFSQVFHNIKKNYVNDISEQQLLQMAIQGMLEQLDPHSSYLDASEFQDLQNDTRGEFAGIGVEVMLEDGLIKVVSPIDNSPAKTAGILSGDKIIKIDEHSVQGSNLNQSVDLLRGKKGSKVTLLILREGHNKPLTFQLTRDIIKLESVTAKILEPGLGYLRIAQFQENTTDDAKQALANLQKNQALQGLVLDLRNNPGGLLKSAVGISDLFLPEGLIVYTQGRSSERQDYPSKPEQMLAGKPVIVLVNQGSASASEIVAGALQDHKRALVVGQTTFGKGSVQTILPVTDTTAIKLTTARYYTPNGRSIQAKGITPDIALQNGKLSIQQSQGETEASLPKHLEAEQSKTQKTKTSTLAQDDYLLYQALNLLKAQTLQQR